MSIINDVGGRFQREVKHHFGNTSISDRDIDFWKTLANWYVDYERVKNFSNYILSTTATIKSDSPFHSWNNIKKTEKLKCLKDIGATSKKTEETFRNQYNRIFGDSYDCLLYTSQSRIRKNKSVSFFKKNKKGTDFRF